MLSDQNAETVNRLGIRNESHEEGTFAYGVPHPGVILVDSEGTIVLKRSEEKYSTRPDMDELLVALTEEFGDGEETESEGEGE